MKLLEKIKNTFFEEEEIMVEEPLPKKETVARKVEPIEVKTEKKAEDILKEVEEDLIEESKMEYYSDSELVKKDNKVPYFEEDDFLENDYEETAPMKEEEPKKLYGQSVDKLYESINYSISTNNKPYGAPLKEAFKPTPVISPIYGILDKNYKKEEVVDRKDKPSSYVSRKNADLDSIRKKAYGGLDPLEEVTTQKKEIEPSIEDDGLLYDMTSDNSKPVVSQVTIADAEEYFEDLGLEYNIDYKDNCYEKATGRRTSTKKVVEETEDTSNDANLEDNLFDLIDSMYEGGEE